MTRRRPQTSSGVGTTVTTTRRGQTEMIGVALIAVLLIVGVLILARVGSDNDRGAGAVSAAKEQEAKSFLIALLATEVPRCGMTVQEVARACLEDDTHCVSADPCRELQEALDTVAAATLDATGARYNLSVEGTHVAIVSECESADRRVLLEVAARQPIIGSGGMSLERHLALAVCRQ